MISFNARLAACQGFDYIDLFPRTDISLVEDAKHLFKISKETVTIPSTDAPIIEITHNFTKSQSEAPFYVFNASGPSLEETYNSISQIQINETDIRIIRCFNSPEENLTLDFYFLEGENP